MVSAGRGKELGLVRGRRAETYRMVSPSATRAEPGLWSHATLCQRPRWELSDAGAWSGPDGALAATLAVAPTLAAGAGKAGVRLSGKQCCRHRCELQSPPGAPLTVIAFQPLMAFPEVWIQHPGAWGWRRQRGLLAPARCPSLGCFLLPAQLFPSPSRETVEMVGPGGGAEHRDSEAVSLSRQPNSKSH